MQAINSKQKSFLQDFIDVYMYTHHLLALKEKNIDNSLQF